MARVVLIDVVCVIGSTLACVNPMSPAAEPPVRPTKGLSAPSEEAAAVSSRRAGAAAFAVDRPGYLSQHDIVFHTPPTEGWEGFPIGNGDLGAMLWCTQTGISLQINKTDTWDQPSGKGEMLLRSCGHLTLDTATPCPDWLYLDGFEARLSLHRAQADLVATTPFLKLSVRSFVQANRNVLLLYCRAEGQADLAGEGTALRIGLDRWGSRSMLGWYNSIEAGAANGLGRAAATIRKGDMAIKESLQGLDFAVVCRVAGARATVSLANRRRAEAIIPAAPVQDVVLMVAVVTTNESKDPLSAAGTLLDEAEARGTQSLRAEHEQWWARFWDRSFVHLGDEYMENLYYLHLYLMGSSSRGRYPAVFNGAIWTWNHDIRQWCHPHHWNMQQAYWSLCAANHPELMRPYLDTYWRLMPKAEEFARSRGFPGAILWSEKHDYAGHMLTWQAPSFVNDFTPATQIGQFFWQYYLYTGDEAFLKDRAYPFMKKAAAFYLQYLKWDEAKQEYFIFPSSGYENEAGNDFRNTSTDLGMIRASFLALIEASRRLGTDEGDRRQWQKVLDRLAPYCLLKKPETGEMLGLGLERDGRTTERGGGGYGMCSATAPVFPAGVLGIADRGSRFYEAAVRRVKTHPEYINAISPVSVVAARLGLADEARTRLSMTIRQLQHFPQGLFYNIDHWHYLSRYAGSVPNAQRVCQRDYITDRACKYNNIWPTQPFVQCGLEPLGILAATVNEMLLQSHEGILRIFPATPDDWPAAFTLRACGGFLVSSEKDKGAAPRYVVIESLLGNPCRLVNPWPDRPAVVEQIAPSETPVETTADQAALSFATTRGAVYLARVTDTPHPDLATRFTGRANKGPKRYQESSLGKPRDFVVPTSR